MRRVVISEIFDNGRSPADQVRPWLADLARVNRWLGGLSTAEALIGRVLSRVPAGELRYLDVAAGSGEMALALATRMRRRGVRFQGIVSDRDPIHLALAFRDGDGLSRVAADALNLPFPDNSFDLIGCGLFVHHLEPEQIINFVNEGLRAARVAVLINDLRRSPVHLMLAYAATPLFSGPASRHDAIASVRRAYTAPELWQILRHTRASRIEISKHYLFRMGAIAWK